MAVQRGSVDRLDAATGALVADVYTYTRPPT